MGEGHQEKIMCQNTIIKRIIETMTRPAMPLVKTAFLKSTKASETYRQVIRKVANSFAHPFSDFMQTDKE